MSGAMRQDDIRNFSNGTNANVRSPARPRWMTGLGLALVLATGPVLSSCTSTSQTMALGFQASDDAIDLVPVGSSREQVLLSLGSPSTQLNQDGEVFYYISQKKRRTFAFSKNKRFWRSILPRMKPSIRLPIMD